MTVARHLYKVLFVIIIIMTIQVKFLITLRKGLNKRNVKEVLLGVKRGGGQEIKSITLFEF